ncbi:MAG: hypothetical protein Q8O98_01525 [bacterium]|nr:hypothetical protein [bacterium]
MAEKKSEIDELKDTLYSRTEYEEPGFKRSSAGQNEASEAPLAWDSPQLDEVLAQERPEKDSQVLMKKIFRIALIFFFAALAVTAYVFFGGANFVSTKNVDIKVLGPTTARAGDILELGISVANGNNADLEVANLSIQYPQGTRNAEDSLQALTYVREELGEVRAGREVTRTARSVLFGEEGEVKEIKISVEYKIKGSNATFYKDKVYEIIIGEAPVTMTVSQPDLITSGDTLTTIITVTPSSTEILKNVMVRAEYPYGYTPLESTPEALSNGNLWSLGDLAPGSKKTLTIRGRLVGENEEERTFRFYVGVAEAGLVGERFSTTLTSTLETVAIKRPSVFVALELNGESGSSYVAPAGQSISGSVRFVNNLPDKIVNPKVEVKFSGSALDQMSVDAQDGFYDSRTNTITWDIVSSGSAPEIGSGGSGSVRFRFSSGGEIPAGSANQAIEVTASLTGTSLEAGARQIAVSDSSSVKVSSEINLASKALYSAGPFENSGPVPPKVETETTYTIIWTAGNTQNDINGTRVTAALGPNVEWLGASSVNGESVSYNASTRTVVWDIGTLASGAGFSTALREAAFQISLTPSASQAGTAPTLVNSVTLTGTDSFTSEAVSVSNYAINTRLASDPGFVQGDEMVVR